MNVATTPTLTRDCTNDATTPTLTTDSDPMTAHIAMPTGVLAIFDSTDPNYGGLNANRAACFIPKYIG